MRIGIESRAWISCRLTDFVQAIMSEFSAQKIPSTWASNCKVFALRHLSCYPGETVCFKNFGCTTDVRQNFDVVWFKQSAAGHALRRLRACHLTRNPGCDMPLGPVGENSPQREMLQFLRSRGAEFCTAGERLDCQKRPLELAGGVTWPGKLATMPPAPQKTWQTGKLNFFCHASPYARI